MSLADYYAKNFGSTDSQEKVANAEETKLEGILSQLSEEECEKLAEAVDVLEAEGMEFAGGEEKLAAAAELVDSVDGEEVVEAPAATEQATTEKTAEEAAAEWDAAGRIMARAFDQELSNMQKEANEAPAAVSRMEKLKAKGKEMAGKAGAMAGKAGAHLKAHKGKYMAGAGAAAAAGGLAAYLRRKKGKK